MACIMRRPILKRVKPFSNSELKILNSFGPDLDVEECENEIHLRNSSANNYLRNSQTQISSDDIVSACNEFKKGEFVSVFAHLYEIKEEYKIQNVPKDRKLFLGNAITTSNWTEAVSFGILRKPSQALRWIQPIWKSPEVLDLENGCGLACTYSDNALLHLIPSKPARLLVYSDRMDYDCTTAVNICMKTECSSSIKVIVERPADAHLLQTALSKYKIVNVKIEIADQLEDNEMSSCTTDLAIILGPNSKSGLRAQFGMSRINEAYIKSLNVRFMKTFSKIVKAVPSKCGIILSIESLVLQETTELCSQLLKTFNLQLIHQIKFDPRKFCPIHSNKECQISKFRDRAHEWQNIWKTYEIDLEKDTNGHYISIFQKL